MCLVLLVVFLGKKPVSVSIHTYIHMSIHPQKVLWGSTVGYPLDSLASCYIYWRRRVLHAIYTTGYPFQITDSWNKTSLHTFQYLL